MINTKHFSSTQIHTTNASIIRKKNTSIEYITKGSTHTITGAPRQEIPIIRMKRILNKTTTFTTSTRLLYIFFWVFPRRQIVVGRRFGTLYQFHLQRLGVQCTLYTAHPAFEDGNDTGFRNVGQLEFDAGEIPRRKYTIFKSRRKSEINQPPLSATPPTTHTSTIAKSKG